jgi:hypothetical protein
VAHPALTADDVRERLGFARVKRDELVVLNDGDLPSADAQYRQQLVQEFFFHLVGAIEVLSQHVNEARALGLDVEVASASKVKAALPAGDPLRQAITDLYVNTQPGRSVPADLYSDEGVMYRIWNYRHQVTHRRRQPFQFNIELGLAVDYGTALRGRWREWKAGRQPRPEPGRSAHFILDPREPPGTRAPSSESVPNELDRMLELVSVRCEAALALV